MPNAVFSKIVSVCLCSASVIGLMSGIVSADTTSPVVFKQEITATNPNVFDYTLESKTYEYQLAPVTDADILSVSAPDSVKPSAGIVEGLSLSTTSLAFENCIVPAEVELFVDYRDIEFNFNVNAYTTPGIYRYELDNLTTGDSRYVDIYIINDDTKLVFEACIFYETDDFGTDHMTKSTCFTDHYDIDEKTETFMYTAIFRFEDENGNLLVEDVVFNETRTQKAKSAMPIKAKISSFGAGDFIFNEVVETPELALTQYAAIMKTFEDQKYTVISDDVAAHVEGTSWFGDDPETPVIYHVVLRAPQPTPTPVPSEPKTGEDFPVFIYYVIGYSVFTIGAIAAIIVIVNKNKKNSKEEN